MTTLARAVGRRKEAVAHVQLVAGDGQFTINRKSAEDYLPNNNYTLMAIQEMLRSSSSAANMDKTVDTIVQVHGGGCMGQAEAIKLGVARALCQMDKTDDQTLRKTLKTQGYLTQDARVKERRKYGLKKARKASQYHKRSYVSYVSYVHALKTMPFDFHFDFHCDFNFDFHCDFHFMEEGRGKEEVEIEEEVKKAWN